MTQTVETFFEGGVTAAKFEDGAFGTVIGGRIVDDPRMTQQRDYTSGDPIFYPDGNPAMQLVVIVQAFASLGEDDGRRSFYIKGQMKQAVGDALRKHNEKAPRRDGQLWVKYIEDKPTTLKNGRPGNPQKIYAAKYEPPAQAAAGAYFDEAREQAPAAAQMSSNARTDGLACPPSVAPELWARMNPAQQSQLYDALGLPSGGTLQEPTGGAAFRDEPPF